MWYVRSGTKVTGPFAESQLMALRRRGQFSPIHQISTDRIRWESAASLVSMLDSKAASPQGYSEGVSAPRMLPGEDSAASDGQWYYLDEYRQKIGPLSLSTIRSLIQNRGISPQTLVCARGESQWVAVAQHPELIGSLPSSWRMFMVACVLLVLVAGAGGSFVARDMLNRKESVAGTDHGDDANKRGKDGASKSDSDSGAGQGEVRSVDISNDAVSTTINQSVGMVVSYVEIDMDDGVHHERWFGHGTCFVVNAQGFALTNRHVVKDHREWENATPDGRIRKFEALLLKAYERKITPENRLAELLRARCSHIAKVTPHCIVYFGTKGFPCKLQFISTKFDLAVIQIPGLKAPPWFALSTENNVPKLTRVLALGFPGVSQHAVTEAEEAVQQKKSGDTLDEALFGTHDHRDAKKASAFELTPTSGEISLIQTESGGVSNAQHTAAIRGGNSGGPLVFRDESRKAGVYAINTLVIINDAPVFVAFPVAQMKSELEEEAKVPDLKWR